LRKWVGAKWCRYSVYLLYWYKGSNPEAEGEALQRMDQQEALRAGLATRPLTTKFVEKQLGDMGLEAEFATHSRIRGLSGGQKVRLSLSHIYVYIWRSSRRIHESAVSQEDRM
jgi:elongation factor 3